VDILRTLSHTKIKQEIPGDQEGLFKLAVQLRNVKDPLFEEKFNHIELSALRSFKNVTQDFLGNKKAENYEEIIKELITYYCKMGCRMSLKIHSSTLT
jgi:hypothetical protein